MTKFDELYDLLIINLASAMQVTELYNQVLEIAEQTISGLGNVQHPTTGANSSQNQIKVLRKLSDNPKIIETKIIVGGLQIVLMVSFLEVYLKDLTKSICNDYISYIKWPEKSSGKIDLAELDDQTSVGDLVLNVLLDQKGVNFQDLQSILRFFKDYMKINVILDKAYIDNIILATAIRHSVIHSAGLADSAFKKQVRELPRQFYEKYIDDANMIKIDELFLNEVRDTMLEFAAITTIELNQKFSK